VRRSSEHQGGRYRRGGQRSESHSLHHTPI
jgi:hypothetical protein